MSYPQLWKRDDKEKWRLSQLTDWAEQTALPPSRNCLLFRYSIQPRPTEKEQWHCILVTLTTPPQPPKSQIWHWHFNCSLHPFSHPVQHVCTINWGIISTIWFCCCRWSQSLTRMMQAIMIPVRQQAYHPGSLVNTRQRSVCSSTVISNCCSPCCKTNPLAKKTVITLTLVKEASNRPRSEMT